MSNCPYAFILLLKLSLTVNCSATRKNGDLPDLWNKMDDVGIGGMQQVVKNLKRPSSLILNVKIKLIFCEFRNWLFS